MTTIRRITIDSVILGDRVLPVEDVGFPDRAQHPVWYEWTPFADAENRRVIAYTTRPWLITGVVFYDLDHPGRWASAHGRLNALAALMKKGDAVDAHIPSESAYTPSKWKIIELRRTPGPSGTGPHGFLRALRWRLELQPDFGDGDTDDEETPIV